MSEKERLQLENELLLTCSKAQAINKYIDELEESSKLSELWCKSQQENKQLKEVIEEVREEIEKSVLIEGVRETGIGYYENIKANKTKLLQILDKVKEMSNE